MTHLQRSILNSAYIIIISNNGNPSWGKPVIHSFQFWPLLRSTIIYNWFWFFCVRSNIFRDHSWYAIWFSKNQRNMPIFITGTWHPYFWDMSEYKVICTINRICTLYKAILPNPWSEVFPINSHLIFSNQYYETCVNL